MRDPHPEHARALDFDRWRVADITTCDLWTAVDDRRAAEAAADMEAMAFAAAPLASDGRLVFIPEEHRALGDLCVRDLARPVRDAEVVDGAAPLWCLADVLKPGAWPYVHRDGGFVGIVSTADLVKPAARMAMLAPVLSFEAALAVLLPTYADGRLADLVDGRTKQQMEARRSRGVATGEELEDVELLTFSERLALVGKLSDLQRDLGSAITQADLDEVKRVRNRLAHGGPLAAGARSNLHVLRALLPVLDLARRAWDLVDELVDAVGRAEGDGIVGVVRGASLAHGVLQEDGGVLLLLRQRRTTETPLRERRAVDRDPPGFPVVATPPRAPPRSSPPSRPARPPSPPASPSPARPVAPLAPASPASARAWSPRRRPPPRSPAAPAPRTRHGPNRRRRTIAGSCRLKPIASGHGCRPPPRQMAATSKHRARRLRGVRGGATR
ncbi:hypothetical protein L6R53_04835 [Myxococcota bacterium]|nr:hypothetical protein [Myxococcota bacterium]